jgi:pyridinium-3,5-bisthiocarboxylic acid mononucleotide nickel chelatase
MKTLCFNCASGISGDMVVGALLDLGLKKEFLIDELKKLKLKNYKLEIRKVIKKGVKATKFDVITEEEKKHRNLQDINLLIGCSGLSNEVKSLSKKIFYTLAKAEAKVHKTTINEVHFHEVGAIDSIIDIVAASILVDKLGVDQIFVSQISVGIGTTKCSHGIMKLPVPAVKELLKNFPLTVLKINKELTTPTGAAIVKTLSNDFIDKPDVEVYKKGYGAGTRDLDIANVLEVVMYDMNLSKDERVLLETNIDDMNPEFYEYIIEKLIKEGAIDAFVRPVIMKKKRPGVLLTVLCKPDVKDKMIGVIFDETTTFGIRINNVSRIKLDREIKKVDTKYGLIEVKIGRYNGIVKTISPEYESCKKIAKENSISLKKIYDMALIEAKCQFNSG